MHAPLDRRGPARSGWGDGTLASTNIVLTGITLRVSTNEVHARPAVPAGSMS